MEVVARTNEDGTREPAGLTCRVPPTGGIPSIPEVMARSDGLVLQQATLPDGKIATVRLPMVGEPGAWFKVAERQYEFRRPDGSRRMVFVG